MTQKNMADVITLTGVAAILSVVVFATSNDIPVGEMAYQKLWLGRMAFVFVICCLLSFCLNRKNNHRDVGIDCIGRNGSRMGIEADIRLGCFQSLFICAYRLFL